MEDREQSPQARETEARIRAALEPLILGRVLAPWRCCCGALGNGEARAMKVTCWPDAPDKTYAWSVEMVETADPAKGYSIGLSAFVAEDVIDRIFAAREERA